MRQVCRPYIFTASLPPSVVATAAASIRQLMKAGEKRERLWQNSIKLHEGLRARGFELATDKPESAIVALVMRDMEHGVRLWEALLDAGIYVNLARPPATPEGMTLLRCSLCAEHTSEQVEIVLDRFAAAKAAIEA